MSKIGIRYLLYFGVLVGLATALLALLSVGSWLLPDLLGPLPAWLPEDRLEGLFFFTLDQLMLWMDALALSAVLITFSFGLRPDDLPKSAVSALVRFSVMATLVTVGFAFLTLLGQPWVDSRLDNLIYRQVQTRQLEDAYFAIKERGTSQQTASDLDARLHLLKRLGTLRPHQGQMSRERMDYDFELQLLRAHFDLDEFFKLRALPGVDEAKVDPEATVEGLLDRAEQVLAEGSSDHEFLANLWSIQAYRRLMNAADQGRPVDTTLLERAKTIVDESWGRIYEKTLALDERLKASYFFRKGKSLGDFQFQNYLEAYYGFQELHLENPRDAEVTRHWQLSQEKVADQVLFLQEMEVLFNVPGSENLVFLNRNSPLEVVRIGKLLNTSQGVFVKDWEFLRTDAQGRILLHWVAPYGRWTPQGVDFRVWDKDSPRPRFPVVLAEAPGHEFNPEGEVDPPRFQPRVSVSDLELVTARTPRPQTLGTMDLRLHGQAIEALGYNARLFQTEFVLRVATPFAFFIAFLFTFALAWRTRDPNPGRGWWFLIPLLPLVVEFVVQSAEWASRLTVGGMLYLGGMEMTVIALAAAFVILSTWGVVLVARGFRDSRS